MVYIFIILAQVLYINIKVIYALGNDPTKSIGIYKFCYILFGILNIFSLFCTFWNIKKIDFFVIYSCGLTTISIFLCALIHGQFVSVLQTFPHYMYL